MSVTNYTNCIRIERTDGVVLCITELDKDLEINDSVLGFTAAEQTYLSAAGYTPTNMQSTSDNAVNNADIEGVLSAVGAQREDIIGGRYDFAKLHIFLWDYVNNTLIKKLGSGHWGESTLKDGSYIAEFRSLSQQLQQTIGRTYNPECDEQLGGTRCTITLGLFPHLNGIITADSSKVYFKDSNLTEANDYWNNSLLTWDLGTENPLVSSLIEDYILADTKIILQGAMPSYINLDDTYTMIKTVIEDQTVTELGTTTQFTDSNRTEPDNYFNNMTLEFTLGNNITETFIVTSFISNEFTLNIPASFPIEALDEYKVIHTKSGSVTHDATSKIKIQDNTLSSTSYIGMYAEFNSGLNEGEFRLITAHDTDDDIITIQTAFDHNILKDDTYTIINVGDTHMALGEVTGFTDNATFTATLTNTGTYGDDYFNYGKLLFKSGLNDEIHMEVKDFIEDLGDPTNQQFILFLPMSFNIAIGDTFQVFAGCDKKLETCKTKFVNIENFQGFPYVPGIDQISLFGGQ